MMRDNNCVAYFHKDSWPVKRAETAQSWQIISRLSLLTPIVSTKYCPFPEVRRLYNSKFDLFKLFKNVNTSFTIIDGYVDFYNEKFTILSKFFGVRNVWLLNAPIEEMLSFNCSNLKFILHKFFRKLTAFFVDEVVCVTEEMARYAKQELNIRKVTVLGNAADPDIFKPISNNNLNIFNKNYFIVMWAGNGSFPWQGVDFIIQAARALKKNKDILFVLLSDGYWIKEEAENIVYLGAVDFFNLPKYLDMADLLLCLYHPQIKDVLYGSPMKLFEYMAMGKPIIASDLGEIKKVIKNEKNGILINDYKKLAKQILKVKNNSQWSTKMGKMARKSILEDYNWDKFIEKIDKIIKNENKITD